MLAARLERSGWDGSLLAAVTLVSSWPEEIKAATTSSLRLGDRDAHWQDWPAEDLGWSGTVGYFEPSDADIAARPYLVATVNLRFTVPSAALPAPPATSASWLSTGQRAVGVVVAELNRIVGPILSAGLAEPSGMSGSAR